MKRALVPLILLLIFVPLPAASLRAGGDGLYLSLGDLLVSHRAVSFSSGPFIYGNVSGSSFLSFISDPHAGSYGTESTASPGLSGRIRAFSWREGDLSFMTVPGKEPVVSLSYDGRYGGISFLWTRRGEKERDMITDWERDAGGDMFHAALTGRYGPYVKVLAGASLSSRAGLSALFRADLSFGPLRISGTWGSFIGSPSPWKASVSFSLEERRLCIWGRLRYAERSGYSECFTPFSTALGWRLALGKMFFEVEREMHFTAGAERRGRTTFTVGCDEVVFSVTDGLSVLCRAKGGSVSLGVKDSGAWVSVSVVRGRLRVFSEEGKFGLEVTVEFP